MGLKTANQASLLLANWEFAQIQISDFIKIMQKGSCILRMLIAELTDCALWLLAAQLPMRFSKKKSPFYGGHSIARCYAVAIADYQPTWAASQNRII